MWKFLLLLIILLYVLRHVQMSDFLELAFFFGSLLRSGKKEATTEFEKMPELVTEKSFETLGI